MLLDLPLIDADTSVTPLAHSDILQYFYYAGLIYIKLDRLEDAIDALETVSCPTSQASHHYAMLIQPCFCDSGLDSASQARQ